MIRTAVVLLVTLNAPPVPAEGLARAPTFFAISVPNLQESVGWYSNTLGLVPTVLPSSPQSKVALLRGNGLLVELIEHSQAFDVERYVPRLEGRHLVHGLVKIGFFVQDLDATVAALRRRGARFRGSIYTDDIAGARSIILLDNNKNLIQLFESLRNGRARR
jgi:catechol 2,3-dioxygenase-like lactoylglutathione lyase family enzyme